MNATFNELYEKYLKFKKPQLEKGSYLSLVKLGNKIKIYERKKKRTLYIADMSLQWFQYFFRGMATGKYGKCTNRTLRNYYSMIYSFLKQCQIFGYDTNNDYIKFQQYLSAYKVPKYNRPVLLDEELAKLWKYEGYYMKNGKYVKLTSSKKKTRDLFVFQCQVGMRWGDISRLKRRDITSINGRYYIQNFQTQKRKTNISVQLNQLALIIIKRYCPKFETMPPNMPIFRSVFDSSNATHTLQWIAKKAKLDRIVEVQLGRLDKIKKRRVAICEIVSTHWARSKFATDWIVAGKDIYKLKIILGHSSVRTTERYIRTVPNWLPDGIETEMDECMLSLFEI